MFDLKRPCKDCPFLKDQAPLFGLSEGRLREIFEGQAFQCHKTVDYAGETREERSGDRPQQCAGLMSVLHKEGRPNAIMQVADRLTGYDPGTLDHSETCDGIEDAIERHNSVRPIRSKM